MRIWAVWPASSRREKSRGILMPTRALPAVIAGLRDQPLGLGGDILGCQDGTGAHHGFRHLPKEIKLTTAEGMMDRPAACLRRHVRHPYQVKDGQVLGASFPPCREV
jgi:hypothetical protein